MSMIILETDLVTPVEPTSATIVGENRTVLIRPGMVGTVVAVHGHPPTLMSVDVEFLLDEGVFATARVPTTAIVRSGQDS
jgi:hypothetical protein